MEVLPACVHVGGADEMTGVSNCPLAAVLLKGALGSDSQFPTLDVTVYCVPVTIPVMIPMAPTDGPAGVNV